MNEELIEDKSGFSTHVLVCIIYAVLIALFYSPVVLGGKSLIPSLYQPHGVTARGVYGEKGRTPVNSFNVDLATPVYYEFPVNKLVGDMYREGKVPLWNPYQGGGTPLAAQYSTRAFFPYQILEDLAPVQYWDYFILGRLLIAGFFTYLFIYYSGVAGPWSAFIGGLFYMFSGAFTWFINLEQLANTAMTLPVLLFSIDLLASGLPRARWVKVKIVFSAICFALTLLAGQPETALYVLSLALLYYIFRSLTAHGLVQGIKTWPRLAIAFVTGLAISSPLILLFVELVGRGAHIHHAGGLMGTQRLANWRALFNVITPTLSYFPANADMIKGTSLLVKMGDSFFRFLPINGVWDTLGGYTGVLPLFLILSGIFISPLRKKLPPRKHFFFFIFIAAVILLKNAGVRPFILLGKAPLFDMVWSLRWAGPVWVFSVAVAAAMGMALIERHIGISADESDSGERSHLIPPGVVFILAAGLIAIGYLMYSLVPSINLFFHSTEVFNAAMSPFVFPSIISGSLVTLIVIATAFCVTYFWKGEKNIYALIILAIVELWWCVPRGYAPETLAMKWVPLGVGLLGVSFFFRNKIAFTFMALVVFFGAAFFMDTLAPQGYPPRDDPFGTAPYVAAILKDSAPRRPRVAGAYGALIPNYAGVVKLDDIRYVNSVAPAELQFFREKYLSSKPVEGLLESSLWFTGSPERSERQDVKGRHLYKRIETLPENDFMGRERAYSLLGVGYFIFPGDQGYGGAGEDLRNIFEEKFPLIYTGGKAKVYKNPGALPRAFLATKTLKASSWKEAQKLFMEGDFDASDTIVVEEDIKLSPPHVSHERTDATAIGASSGTGALKSAVASLYQYVSKSGPAIGPASAEAASGPVDAAPSMAGHETKAPDNAPAVVSDAPPEAHPATAPSAESETHTDNAPVDETVGAVSEDAVPEAGAVEKVPEAATDKAVDAVTEKHPEAVSDKSTSEEVPEAAPEKAVDTVPEATTEVVPHAEAPEARVPLEFGAVITDYSEGKVIVDVRSDRDAVLVLGDIYYPGWKVKVNGERAGIIRVNGLVRGVQVKEGRSKVVFYYMPLKFLLGLGIMAIAGIFCIFLIYRDIKGD